MNLLMWIARFGFHNWSHS